MKNNSEITKCVLRLNENGTLSTEAILEGNKVIAYLVATKGYQQTFDVLLLDNVADCRYNLPYNEAEDYVKKYVYDKETETSVEDTKMKRIKTKDISITKNVWGGYIVGAVVEGKPYHQVYYDTTEELAIQYFKDYISNLESKPKVKLTVTIAYGKIEKVVCDKEDIVIEVTVEDDTTGNITTRTVKN